MKHAPDPCNSQAYFDYMAEQDRTAHLESEYEYFVQELKDNAIVTTDDGCEYWIESQAKDYDLDSCDELLQFGDAITAVEKRFEAIDAYCEKHSSSLMTHLDEWEIKEAEERKAEAAIEAYEDRGHW